MTLFRHSLPAVREPLPAGPSPPVGLPRRRPPWRWLCGCCLLPLAAQEHVPRRLSAQQLPAAAPATAPIGSTPCRCRARQSGPAAAPLAAAASAARWRRGRPLRRPCRARGVQRRQGQCGGAAAGATCRLVPHGDGRARRPDGCLGLLAGGKSGVRLHAEHVLHLQVVFRIDFDVG